jgi:4-hydroxyphenylpyruvate dioxygenase
MTNPVGMDGIEFVEYATPRPLEFGALVQKLGFVAVARHRSREVTLYRQGGMNLIVNAHLPKRPAATLSAVALRVRDAAFAHQRSLDLGAWDQPTRAAAMELNIPGIHGAGDSLIYFVDRYQDFSIYDVDFVPLPGAEPRPPAVAGLHWFGIVQSILAERTGDWLDFYETLFGFSAPAGSRSGGRPGGTLLESPCHKFHVRLMEPPSRSDDARWEEGLVRVGLGAPNVPLAARTLGERGIAFVERGTTWASDEGALTQVYQGGVTFELVASRLAP